MFIYVFSNHLKDFERGEPSNLLYRLGSRIENGIQLSRRSMVLADSLKVGMVWVGGVLALSRVTDWRLVWYGLFAGMILGLLYYLLKPRPYDHGKVLFQISLMEILSSYAILPVLLDPWVSVAVMGYGIVYFFGMNKLLWRKTYPRV